MEAKNLSFGEPVSDAILEVVACANPATRYRVMAAALPQGDRITCEQALKACVAKQREDAMKTEVRSVQTRKLYEISTLPADLKAMMSRWIYNTVHSHEEEQSKDIDMPVSKRLQPSRATRLLNQPTQTRWRFLPLKMVDPDGPVCTRVSGGLLMHRRYAHNC